MCFKELLGCRRSSDKSAGQWLPGRGVGKPLNKCKWPEDEKGLGFRVSVKLWIDVPAWRNGDDSSWSIGQRGQHMRSEWPAID